MDMIRTLRRALPLLATCLSAVALCGCGSTHRRVHRATPQTSTTVPATGAGDRGVVTYGIGDAQGQFASCATGEESCCSARRAHCALSRMRGYFDNPLFLRLLTPSSAHQVRDVRFFVDYDAVQTWNGSTSAPGCVYSPTVDRPYYDVANGWHTAALSIDDLVAGVIEARAEGLTPVVSIEGFSYASATPPGDQPFPDPTTTAGYWDYRCGLLGILGVMGRLPAWEQPHDWEAVNEPEGFQIFRSTDGQEASGCPVGSSPQPNGPAKAACVEMVASHVIHGYDNHGHDTVIAGTFKHPYTDYLAPYVRQLEKVMPGAAFPPIWSVHDYREVTDAYSGVSPGELASFDRALARDTEGRARSLWVTEAGTVLTSELRGGDCPAVGVDRAGTLGACISGQPDRQAADASAFFNLSHVASAVPITHLFWYQFQSAVNWDSGLVDSSGRPRAGYCAFYGSGTCDGDPNAL
jgi:hypothetical protein